MAKLITARAAFVHAFIAAGGNIDVFHDAGCRACTDLREPESVTLEACAGAGREAGQMFCDQHGVVTGWEGSPL